MRQTVGADHVELELPGRCTAALLLQRVASAYPRLAPVLVGCRVAVDREFMAPDEEFATDGELALIPPVSGGHDGADRTRGRHSLLSSTPITLDGCVADLGGDSDLGGLNCFVGKVRRASRGKTVVCLEYEAYAKMALAVMDRIVDELLADHDDCRLSIHHRLGRLIVGEIAVVIAAGAPHRAESFELCRGAIEALKRDVPIWKREIDAEGGEWIGQGP